MKVGRNDPCPCGSGKKYKKCCEKKSFADRVQPISPSKISQKMQSLFKKEKKD